MWGIEVAAADWTMQNSLREVGLQDAAEGRGDVHAGGFEPAAGAPAPGPPPAAPVGEPAPDP